VPFFPVRKKKMVVSFFEDLQLSTLLMDPELEPNKNGKKLITKKTLYSNQNKKYKAKKTKKKSNKIKLRKKMNKNYC